MRPRASLIPSTTRSSRERALSIWLCGRHPPSLTSGPATGPTTCSSNRSFTTHMLTSPFLSTALTAHWTRSRWKGWQSAPSSRTNVCTFGPSGTDKTFITKAIAVEACRKGYRTEEIHCLSFISELLTLYRTDRTRYGKKQKYYSRIPVLLIDGWFVCMPKVDETTILFDLVERRYGNTSTVISFQMPPTNWAKACGNEAMGKSVVGRLLNASFPTDLTRSADMRNTHSQPAGQATSPHQNIHPPLSARC